MKFNLSKTHGRGETWVPQSTPPKTAPINNVDLFRKNDFLNVEKKLDLGLGSAFFGISDLGFLPYGVPIKGVIEKGLIFDENTTYHGYFS